MISTKLSVAVFAMCVATLPAFAQQRMTKAVEVGAGATASLGSFANLTADCSPGPLPEVKMLSSPRTGTVAVLRQRGKLGPGTRCPHEMAIAQVVQYRANAVPGQDDVTFEVKLPAGQVVVHHVRITIKDAPPSSPERGRRQREI